MAWIRRKFPHPLRRDDVLRFLSHVREEENGCWTWKGTRTAPGSFGYGICRWRGKNRTAHRVSYEIFVGEPLPGFEIDHRCGNKACVNPDHLEAATHAENMRRCARRGQRHHFGRMTHCKRGHPLSGENLRVYVGRDGQARRTCRACRAERARARRARLKQAPPIGEAPLGPTNALLGGLP